MTQRAPAIVSMAVPPELLERFDRALRGRGFSTRSEAFRDALRTFVDEAGWEVPGADSALILTILYSKRHSGGDLSAMQHHFPEIHSALHMHLDEVNCLEILVARGDSARLRELVGLVRRIRGIKKVGFIAAARGV